MRDRHDDVAGDDRPTDPVEAPGTRDEPNSDASTPLDLDRLDGEVIAGRYDVAQVVSAGSNTVIVDALDRRAPDPAGSPVTLKIVRPELVARPDFRPKFAVLSELTQALTHPNISSVLDAGELDVLDDDGRTVPSVFWVVDALGGGSLRDLLDRGRTLTPGQALVVGLEACRALDAAHQRGLFHTELTPAKMVFGADRRLRIVDFGMARLLAEPTWEDPASVPTHVARYASPEQAIGLPIDAKTDVYALALVLVEAVTGQVPFAADSTVATLAGRVDRLLPVSADLGALAAILERAARPESDDRYSAAELGRALVGAAGKLARPEPIPILATGSFDSTASSMRRPVDPTGGLERPDALSADGAGAVTAVVTDLEATAADADGDGDTAALAVATAAAGAAGAGAMAGASLADTDIADAVNETSSAPASEPDVGSDSTVDAPAPAPVVDASAATSATSNGDVADSVDVDASETLEPQGAADDADPDDVVTAVTPGVQPDDDTLGDDSPAIPLATPTEHDLHFTDELLAAAPASTAQMPAALVQSSPLDTPAASPPLFDDEPRRRRRAPIVIAVVVLVAGLAALGYAATLLFQPNSFAVPVLAGQPADRALNQIAGNDWVVSYEYERSDSFPEPQQVIRTEPEPGVELEEGEPFLIVLSEGPEFRVLPELSERTFDDAAGELAALGLNATEAAGREFSETLEIGSVVSWQVIGNATLSAGDQILPGETIELTLSAGPEPRTVPSFAGLTLDGATAQADQVQLQVVSGDGVFSVDVPEGLVVSQEPAEGASLERDGTVTVQLSLGPDVNPLPDLDGLTFDEASALLDEAGFVIGRLLGTTDGVFVELTIAGEEVPPGAEFPRGTVVDVIFL